MKLNLRKILLAALVCLALLYPVYLAVGNWVLLPRLGDWLNRRPERFLIQYRSAKTLFPGVVEVEGFQIRSQTRTIQWWASADRGRVSIRLWSLYDREFVTDFLQAEGVSFRLRRRADAPARRTVTRQRMEPEIPGLANPPRPTPEALYPPKPPAPGKPAQRREPWHIRLAGMELEDLREIWIEEYRFQGRARAAGGFDLRIRQRFALDASRLDVAEGGVFLGKQPVLTGAKGSIYGAIEPYPAGKIRGWDVFQFVDGRAVASGQVPSLQFLDLFVRKTRWLDTRTGGGDVTLDLRMKQGRFLPGTHLVGQPEDLSLALLDYRAQGDGKVVWAVEEVAKGERRGRLDLDFEEFRIQRQGYGAPHVRGRSLSLEILGDEPQVRNLFTPRRMAIELGEAEVPRLTFYNAYLPKRVGLTLTGGTGRMSGRFAAAAPQWTGTGDLRLTSRGLRATYREKPLRANLALHTRLRRIDLLEKRYDISGTQLDLTDVVMPGSAPWWARAHVDRAILEPGAPVFLRADIESTLSDARPLFALFVPETGGGRMLGRLENILDLKGVGATATFLVGADSITVPTLAIASGPAQVLGQFRLQNGDRRGALYARYGRLDVGLELNGNERDWKVLRPKKWYAEYRGANR